MAFAFWFDPTAINGNYAEWAAARVFTSRILQCSGETTRIHIGDLLYYNLPEGKIRREEIANRLQATNTRPGLMRQTMVQALWNQRIHVMYCDELSETTALILHEHLLREPRYMGCYGVDPTQGLHRWLFELNLILGYHIASEECWTPYPEEVPQIEYLRCFQHVLHVPVLESDFVNAVEWLDYCRTTPPEERWIGC